MDTASSMKRQREEEDGEEEQPQEEEEQEQALPTPMAVSPVRNPSPAPAPASSAPAPASPGSPISNLWPTTATPPPSGDSRHGRVVRMGRRPVTWDDALDFVLSVRNAFNQAQYQEFIHIFSLFDSIGARGLVDRMRVLLRDYPQLKRQFNLFVPVHHELNPSDDDDDQ